MALEKAPFPSLVSYFFSQHFSWNGHFSFQPCWIFPLVSEFFFQYFFKKIVKVYKPFSKSEIFLKFFSYLDALFSLRCARPPPWVDADKSTHDGAPPSKSIFWITCSSLIESTAILLCSVKKYIRLVILVKFECYTNLQCSKQTYFCEKIDKGDWNSHHTNLHHPRNFAKKILVPHSSKSVQPILQNKISLLPPRGISRTSRYKGSLSCRHFVLKKIFVPLEMGERMPALPR